MRKDSVNVTVKEWNVMYQPLVSNKAYVEDFIRDLSANARLIVLEQGETLFSLGEEANVVHFLLDGLLEAAVLSHQGSQNVVNEIKPGEPVGIIPVFLGGTQTATVSALTRCTLAEMDCCGFMMLVERYSAVLDYMMEISSCRIRRSHLAEILPDYFEKMDEATFDYIESLFHWVHVKRGDILYNKGDIGDSLYILVNGLLHVIDEERSDPHRVLATIGRGEIVGEMAILSDEIRTASIHAARDCDLVKLSRSSFENISEKFPQVMMAITRILVDRLKNIRSGKEPKRSAINFVVLPISEGLDVTGFSRKLTNCFNSFGETVLLNEESLDDYLNHTGISTIEENDPREPGLRAKLAEIEDCHSFVIYQATDKASTWTRRSLERADKIILLADADSSPELTAIEKDIQGDDHMTTTPRKVLVLMHRPETVLPEGTSKWLDQRPIRGHYHVRWGSEDDFSRLARILSNRAIGLVLGGGAAKGIAHIGVIKALEEAGIPIDMVGGASMGSIIGAHYAMGNNYDEMLELCKKLFLEMNPFNEYTIPLISLMRGRKLEKMGKYAYGESEVEDLWKNYFCVSSNLTTSQVKVHRRGSLWKAVRTSSSIPGVISPVLEDGEVYVDGGVINNLPGDIMRRQCGVVIVVEVSPNLDLRVKVDDLPSPWKLLMQKLIPFKKKLKIPSIVDIMLSTVLTGSFIAANSVKLDADLSLTPPLSEFGFLDFKKMAKIADKGYQYTKDILSQIDKIKLNDPGKRKLLVDKKNNRL